MKRLWTIVLAFLLAGVACAEESIPANIPLPDLKTPDDLRLFVERGVICKEAWSVNTMFMHEPDFAALKRLGSMVKKMGFATESSFAEEHYFLNIRPGKNKMKIYGFDVEEVGISGYDSIGFVATLNIDKKTVLNRLNALGLDQQPFEHQVGDAGESYFHPEKITDHIGDILVGDLCEYVKYWDEKDQSCRAKKAPAPFGSECGAAKTIVQSNRAKIQACQTGKALVDFGCIWHDL
ncbi:MAG: hypothetical protein LBQ81_07565 [Zoogloeaceae bacterium]|nr:hypothetical protein [Zoogloeaceae bacterium]